MKKILAIALIFAAAACSKKTVSHTSVNRSEPTQADVEMGIAKFSDLTLEQLKEGKSINDASCGRCHRNHQPWELSEEKWRKIVPPMAKKAKLDSHSEDLVLRYLITLSTKK